MTATGFDTAIVKTRDLLSTAADIEVLNQSLDNGKLTVSLRINNRSGHKLPTSYPSRRVYIHFMVLDDSGAIVFESGKLNPDGSIVGADSDDFLDRFEPHYEVITQMDQVQIYESIMANTDNELTYTLLRAAAYLKDNRILPQGLDKNTPNKDIRVAGTAMADDNFGSGADVITYTVQVGDTRNVQFTAELKYQSLAYGFINDLFQDTDNPEVAKFKTMYDNAAIRSETLAKISQTLP